MASRWQEDRVFSGAVIAFVAVVFLASGAAGLYRGTVEQSRPSPQEDQAPVSQTAGGGGSIELSSVADESVIGGVMGFQGSSTGPIAGTSSGTSGGGDGGLLGVGGMLEDVSSSIGDATGASGDVVGGVTGTARDAANSVAPGTGDRTEEVIADLLEAVPQSGTPALSDVVPSVGF